MGYNSCPECYDEPCTCGYMYRDWSHDRKLKVAAGALGVSVEVLKVMIEWKVASGV